ncbi:aspartate/glutamate racemase family protein [Natronocalculus amylovorans]|uniref:Aspartate/glutamate racemase family protein n=1 Tax=Natronocalculus amylovorans TaxID=2917812 RepID=A0AAE3K8J7_9EURY|nr:aspartate/glutamate racemase family protein [Natronocalculus amylovorans]MCL9816595.1 aspartate/glutamate racemase family protein [Natronocalculus amylovorans]
MHRSNSLRTVGILGGMSSQSTIEYYRAIDAGINEEYGGHAAAEILIRSVDFGTVEECIRTDEWDRAARYLAGAAHELERGGADFVLMATNTMHRVAPQITDALTIPFVHIVDPTAEAIADADISRVGVLGTQATMESQFYPDRFAEHGIETVFPDRSDRERLDRIIFDELTKGVLTDESKNDCIAVIDRLKSAGAAGIVLGCTEFELLLSPDDIDIPLFDTTALHVDRAVSLALDAGDPEPAGVSMDGRVLQSIETVGDGNVDAETTFYFSQSGTQISAHYSGGSVQQGFLVGTSTGNELSFRYTQLLTDGSTATGASTDRIELLSDGRVRLHETWSWDAKDGSGTSILEEKPL